MELRQLEAFVAVATELHFGRAAEGLHLGQPTLSDLIRRLEREVGTALFTRTTRHVALTGAGAELLGRAKVILDDVAAARAAVRRIASGDAGTVRVGITPPVAPVLAPHLRAALEVQAPGVELAVTRMWLPDLTRAVADGDVDVALTCGLVPQPNGVVGAVFCAEPLFVGVRTTHRLAGRDSVALAQLAHDVLAMPDDTLFPAWALAQRQALAEAGITPPHVILDAPDLGARAWTRQVAADWVLMTASISEPAEDVVTLPLSPVQLLPFTLQWNPERAQTAAVARFVHLALTSTLPATWQTMPGHLHHSC